MFCEHCGKQLEEEEKFCPYCGKQQDSADTEPISGKEKSPKKGMETTERNFPKGEFKGKRTLATAAMLITSLILVLMLIFSFCADIESKRTKGDNSLGMKLYEKLENMTLHNYSDLDDKAEHLEETAEDIAEYNSLSIGNIISLEKIFLEYTEEVYESNYNSYIYIMALLAWLGIVKVLTACICFLLLVISIVKLFQKQRNWSGIGRRALIASGAVLYELFTENAVIHSLNQDYFEDTIVKGSSILSVKLISVFLLLGTALVLGVIKAVSEYRREQLKAFLARLLSVLLLIVAVFAVWKLSSAVLQTKISYKNEELDFSCKDKALLSFFNLPLMALFLAFDNAIKLHCAGTVLCMGAVLLGYISLFGIAGNFLKNIYDSKKIMVSSIVFSLLAIISLTTAVMSYQSEIKRICRAEEHVVVEYNSSYTYEEEGDFDAEFETESGLVLSYVLAIVLAAGAAAVSVLGKGSVKHNERTEQDIDATLNRRKGETGR